MVPFWMIEIAMIVEIVKFVNIVGMVAFRSLRLRLSSQLATRNAQPQLATRNPHPEGLPIRLVENRFDLL